MLHVLLLETNVIENFGLKKARIQQSYLPLADEQRVHGKKGLNCFSLRVKRQDIDLNP